ncbi:hypothetical protein N335_06349, partial [Phaethon lepturus]
WPLTKDKLLAAHQIINREVEQGHLEESFSPWNTPIFVIQKKDKSKFRLLHDLREVNKCMEDMGALQPGLPLPSAIPVNWPVVVMDIKDWFFSIPLAPQDSERFAFTVPSTNLCEPAKRYQWKVLPQGMKNSPTICQAAVARVLEPLRRRFANAIIIHYMDDLLIAAATQQQVDETEKEIVKQLADKGLHVQETKTQKGDSITYLGTRISPQSVVPQPLKFNIQVKTLHDVQKLVGVIQWVRNLIGIPNEMMLPLFELL